MATVRNRVDAHIAIPAPHILENSFGKQIGLLPAQHQNWDVDGIPVFPKVDAVMPGVAKGMANVRVA
jgi:hypothetical protein